MQGLPWFRMYVDFLEDPKILSLAFEDQRHFIGILALKSAGVIDQACDSKVMNRIVAQKLWIDHSAIDEVKRRLIEAKLIDEKWQPLAWSRRQFSSDNSTERTRKYRKKQKDTDQERHGNVSSNVTGTSQERRCDGTDTDTDTDKTRKEKKNPPNPPSAKGGSAARVVVKDDDLPDGVSVDAWRDWEQHRTEIGHPLTALSAKRLLAKLDRLRGEGHDPQDIIDRAIEHGWRGLFPPDAKPNSKPNGADPPLDEREARIQTVMHEYGFNRRDSETFVDHKPNGGTS